MLKGEQEGVPLVVWSGGVDSTALLQRLLGEFRYVDVVIGELTIQTNKTAREAKAITELTKIFIKMRKDSPDYIGSIRYAYRIPLFGAQFNSAQTVQGPMWLMAALPCIKPDTLSVNLGYVLGDSAAQLGFHSLKQAWPHLFNSTSTPSRDGKVPELAAPFLYNHKRDLIGSMYPKLLKVTSWCESTDEGTDCGVCASCERMVADMAAYQVLQPEVYSKLSILPRIKGMLHKRTQRNKPIKNTVQLKG